MAELCIERRTPRHLWPTVTATAATTKHNDGIDVSMVHKNKANMPKTRSVCCENRVYFIGLMTATKVGEKRCISISQAWWAIPNCVAYMIRMVDGKGSFMANKSMVAMVPILFYITWVES